jgi:hypothetical protein
MGEREGEEVVQEGKEESKQTNHEVNRDLETVVRIENEEPQPPALHPDAISIR